jgi:voltage-gated potassium channel
MIPHTLVRRLLKVRVKFSRSRLLWVFFGVTGLALTFALLFSYFESVDFSTALYWAIITMATIGYGDVTPKTEAGRILAMTASVVGISTFTALVSLLAEYMLSSSMRRMMGMHRVKYNKHYVVIGQGSSVTSCVRELLGAIEMGEVDARPVVVVLPSEEERRKIELPEEVEVIIGDSTTEETLQRAGVPSASYVMLALEDDSKSVFSVLMIKRISSARVFVEALKPESFHLLQQAGADRVITSRSLAGRLLASSVFEPEAVDFIEDITSSSEGYDVTVLERQDLWGLSYLEALKRLHSEGYHLVGYHAGKLELTPSPEDPIPHGAKVVVIKRVSSSRG